MRGNASGDVTSAVMGAPDLGRRLSLCVPVKSFQNFFCGSTNTSTSPVKQFMIKNPVVANSTDTVEAAAKKMETGNYNQLPIVQGNGHLVGMLQDIQILSVFL